MSDDLDGIRVIWNGAPSGGIRQGPGLEGHVHVVEETRGVQADLYFCPIKCVREFLNACVVELDCKVAETSNISNNRVKLTP